METVLIASERLQLRELEEGDAPFILELLNDPDFLQHIGDKGVRTLDDARRYIADGPVASYNANGHGLYHVAIGENGLPIGMCGLVRRPNLPHADIGYAFLPQFRGRGYAFEAARAVLDHARTALGLTDILAIVSPANTDSIKLLGKLGMKEHGLVRMANDAPEVMLFST